MRLDMRRRDMFALAATGLVLPGCGPAQPALQGGFDGAAFERGHLLRENPRRWPTDRKSVV